MRRRCASKGSGTRSRQSDVLTESYRAAQASAGDGAEVTVFSLLRLSGLFVFVVFVAGGHEAHRDVHPIHLFQCAVNAVEVIYGDMPSLGRRCHPDGKLIARVACLRRRGEPSAILIRVDGASQPYENLSPCSAGHVDDSSVALNLERVAKW